MYIELVWTQGQVPPGVGVTGGHILPHVDAQN